MVVKITIDVSQIEDFARKMERMNTKLVQEVHDAFRIGAQLIKADAQADCPYKTGFLRSTIYAVVKRIWHIVIGAWAYYGKYQEFGTIYIRARMFIQNAIKRRWPQIRDLIRRALIIAMESER